MSESILKITGVKATLNNLKNLKANMLRDLRGIMNVNALKLQTHIKEDLISFNPGLFSGGTSDSTLASRSGQLKRSIRPVPFTYTEALGMRTGLYFGTPYAKVHIGPPGQSMTITSNRPGGWLAIPLPAAQGAHGQAKGGPRDTALWGNTFILRSNKGNPIIFGYKGGQTAAAGKARKLEALFVLKKSVTVKTRIHPTDLLQWIEPKLISDVKEAEKTWLQ